MFFPGNNNRRCDETCFHILCIFTFFRCERSMYPACVIFDRGRRTRAHRYSSKFHEISSYIFPKKLLKSLKETVIMSTLYSKELLTLNQQRERLGSRLGFILLSAGCAIGCGNVWKFPWMTGQNGGGGFGSSVVIEKVWRRWFCIDLHPLPAAPWPARHGHGIRPRPRIPGKPR